MAHDVSRQQMQAINVAAICILSNHLDTLSFYRRRATRVNKMKALLCSLILGLLVASQGDAQIDASQVPGAFEWWSELGRKS